MFPAAPSLWVRLPPVGSPRGRKARSGRLYSGKGREARPGRQGLSPLIQPFRERPTEVAGLVTDGVGNGEEVPGQNPSAFQFSAPRVSLRAVRTKGPALGCDPLVNPPLRQIPVPSEQAALQCPLDFPNPRHSFWPLCLSLQGLSVGSTPVFAPEDFRVTSSKCA